MILLKNKKHKDFVKSSIPVNWVGGFYLDKKIELSEIANEIEKKTGLKLMAKKKDDIVNGFLTSQFFIAQEDKICGWCEKKCKKGEHHQCVIVQVYDIDEKPLSTVSKFSFHESKIKKMKIDKDKEESLRLVIRKLKGIK